MNISGVHSLRCLEEILLRFLLLLEVVFAAFGSFKGPERETCRFHLKRRTTQTSFLQDYNTNFILFLRLAYFFTEKHKFFAASTFKVQNGRSNDFVSRHLLFSTTQHWCRFTFRPSNCSIILMNCLICMSSHQINRFSHLFSVVFRRKSVKKA